MEILTDKTFNDLVRDKIKQIFFTVNDYDIDEFMELFDEWRNENFPYANKACFVDKAVHDYYHWSVDYYENEYVFDDLPLIIQLRYL